MSLGIASSLRHNVFSQLFPGSYRASQAIRGSTRSRKRGADYDDGLSYVSCCAHVTRRSGRAGTTLALLQVFLSTWPTSPIHRMFLPARERLGCCGYLRLARVCPLPRGARCLPGHPLQNLLLPISNLEGQRHVGGQDAIAGLAVVAGESNRADG
ncbi:hypothetical protein LZ30DRAFT_137205 [Colletotrichum cereale]|nr:hypothetical protein LZ30DRAFT_137205 [Colletotrichum cereale]